MEMPPGPPPIEGGPPPPPEEPQELEALEAGADDLVEPEPGRDGLLSDETANRRLVATTAALALMAVAFMITVFLVTQDTGDEALPAPPTGAPPASTALPATIEPAALEGVVEELQDFVADERQLEFTEDIEHAVLDRAAYEERVRSDFDADVAEDAAHGRIIREQADFYRALGLWTTDEDPVEVVRDYIASGSVGFYDPATDELVINGGRVTPLLRSTLVHELTHALDDQHFDLDRPQLETATDETGRGFHAVVEGSARRVQTAYEETLSDDELAAMAIEAETLVDPALVQSFPAILRVEQSFVYNNGQQLVDELVDGGGFRAVNRALREPPTTSEQVLEPETFLDGETSVEVTVPDADGEPTSDGIAGQFLFAQLASFGGTPEEPHELLAEWDGDRYVIWEDGDDVCTRLVVEGDATVLADELEPWTAAVAAEAVAELVVDGEQLVITSCG